MFKDDYVQTVGVKRVSNSSMTIAEIHVKAMEHHCKIMTSIGEREEQRVGGFFTMNYTEYNELKLNLASDYKRLVQFQTYFSLNSSE